MWSHWQIALILLEILNAFFSLLGARDYSVDSPFLGNQFSHLKRSESKSSSCGPPDSLCLVFNFSGSHSSTIIIINRREGRETRKPLNAGKGKHPLPFTTQKLYKILFTYENQDSCINTNGFHCHFTFAASAIIMFYNYR